MEIWLRPDNDSNLLGRDFQREVMVIVNVLTVRGAWPHGLEALLRWLTWGEISR